MPCPTCHVAILAAADGASDPLLQYGLPGIGLLLALGAVRVLFTKLQQAYERERDRADRLEAALMRQHQTIEDRTLTVLGDVTKATADLLNALQDRG